MKVLILFCILTIYSSDVKGQKCPDIPLAANFQPKKFLGKWYAIETSGIEMPCASFDVQETANPLTYKINLQPAGLNLELTPKSKNARDLSEGFLEKSPFPLLNNGNLRIFETDYDNYAGVIECNDSQGYLYMSISFGSRKNSLSDDIINKMKNKLIGYGIDVSGLKVVSHSGCL